MHAVNPPLPEGPLLDNLGAAAWNLALVRGEGARVEDEAGRGYWDFYGGHAVTLLGHAHPRWAAALAEQAARLGFFSTVARHPLRERAAARLVEFCGMDVAFFVNSGAEANEAALKIARKATGRPVVVAMEGSFHGRTMGALGVTWRYREQHAPPCGATRFVPFGDAEALAAALDDEVAAVIAEPIQGVAGMVEPPPGWLARARDLAHAHGALFIADEVQSGMGRTGRPLALHREGVRADIVTVGKGLGGGFPVAAALMRREVAATVRPGEHGTTFGGGPLACAAVDVTLDILRDEAILERALALEADLRRALALPGVRELRGAGAWLGLVLDRPARPVAAALREAGVLAGTAADPRVLRLSPPAVMPPEGVAALAEALAAILAQPAPEESP